MGYKMSPPYDSLDVTLGTIMSRIDKSEKDINETHARLRESTNRLDQLTIYNDDCRNRIMTLEEGFHLTADKHYEVAKKVEMLETKLDDMRFNLTKVVEGQIDILNSNASTREQFSAVLTTQEKQHKDWMKRIRTFIYIGGGLLFLASQLYAKYIGSDTVLDNIIKFIQSQ
jgi:bacterioferritin (cytochrome b1)